ncbi:hypothetical protein [Curtobacterium sp. Leaf261]|uniref:hypothetical protein n=1 Tax=Curtobacterium sp. Leaf261 TaxID=1736311 RepID=UPI0006F769B3|nr:hypothetical protein [Curtobacterium sp. Leaf261]KQO61279.1 hypothetical protein ASF23_12360 [Curtobacterium sp. Leaf261]
MAERRRPRGPRAAAVAVVAAVMVVGGALALRGLDGSDTPSATTMDAASGSSSTAASAQPSRQPTADPPTAGSDAASDNPDDDPDDATDTAGHRGTAVFAPSGADLPGATTLARCGSDRRSAVARYDTAALGAVTLQCGDSGQGYQHIEMRHERDWDDELASTRTERDWDDLMLTAVRIALTEPGSGLPADAGDGKVCYSAPIRFADGGTPRDPFVKVIVSATTDRVITAYPTSREDC